MGSEGGHVGPAGTGPRRTAVCSHKGSRKEVRLHSVSGCAATEMLAWQKVSAVISKAHHQWQIAKLATETHGEGQRRNQTPSFRCLRKHPMACPSQSCKAAHPWLNWTECILRSHLWDWSTWCRGLPASCSHSPQAAGERCCCGGVPEGGGLAPNWESWRNSPTNSLCVSHTLPGLPELPALNKLSAYHYKQFLNVCVENAPKRLSEQSPHLCRKAAQSQPSELCLSSASATWRACNQHVGSVPASAWGPSPFVNKGTLVLSHYLNKKASSPRAYFRLSLEKWNKQ